MVGTSWPPCFILDGGVSRCPGGSLGASRVRLAAGSPVGFRRLGYHGSAVVIAQGLTGRQNGTSESKPGSCQGPGAHFPPPPPLGRPLPSLREPGAGCAVGFRPRESSHPPRVPLGPLSWNQGGKAEGPCLLLGVVVVGGAGGPHVTDGRGRAPVHAPQTKRDGESGVDAVAGSPSGPPGSRPVG